MCHIVQFNGKEHTKCNRDKNNVPMVKLHMLNNK